MTPLEQSQREGIIRRLEFVRVEMGDLEDYAGMDYQRYSRDRGARRIVERIAENVANACIDVAKIMLASEDSEVPETYREALLMLGKLGIVARDTSQAVAELARLRNVLAHQYLDLKWEAVERFIKTGPAVVEAFVEEVEGWLSGE